MRWLQCFTFPELSRQAAVWSINPFQDSLLPHECIPIMPIEHAGHGSIPALSPCTPRWGNTSSCAPSPRKAKRDLCACCSCLPQTWIKPEWFQGSLLPAGFPVAADCAELKGKARREMPFFLRKAQESIPECVGASCAALFSAGCCCYIRVFLPPWPSC